MNKAIELETLTEGGYATLTNLIRVPRFNNKAVKLIAYVEKEKQMESQNYMV